MKLLNAVKFRYIKLLKLAAIFFVLILVMSVAALISGHKDNSSFEMLDAIYTYVYYLLGALAFIFGVISYKPELKLFLQNGISRQSIHLSFILSLAVNAVTVLAAMGLAAVFSLATGSLNGIENPKPIIILVCIAAMSIGYCLAAILYSLKPITKIIIVGALVFAVLMFVLIWIVKMQGDPSVLLYALYCFLFGSVTGFVYMGHLAIALICVTVINLSLSHIIINRAEIKK
ncbi:MAG: hypothetical protein E7514_07020 [Ruminococcaceae bacterium]|nr:hypothetical protein [Oscillospiraceae bacterium]